MNEVFCRVCGCESNTPLWQYLDSKYYPSWDICPCCGCEAGLNDETLEDVYIYRKYWVSNLNGLFQNKGLKPDGWLLSEQLNKIPIEWR